MVLVALTLACIVLFWVSVPLLLTARGRSIAPWWFVIASATAIGWTLTNSAVFFQHRAVDESIRDEGLCFDKAAHDDRTNMKNTGHFIGNGVYETSVEEPCGMGVWAKSSYKPFVGFSYGPLYLICCLLPYWLIIGRRFLPSPKRQIVLLAAGAFAIEWTAIVGECVHPGYLSGLCTKADPFIWPPLTVVAALLIALVISKQLLERFGSRTENGTRNDR